MPQSFTKTGGARIGWLNTSWPFAHLSANHDTLTVSARPFGTYSFSPEQTLSVEKYVLIPVFAWGIRVRHRVHDYPERIIFWSFGNPDELLAGIRNSGFTFAAFSSPIPDRRGIPVRWSAIIAAIIVWNAFFTLPFALVEDVPSHAPWIILPPLFLALGLTVATLTSLRIQRVILKPGRNVGEIRHFLRFMVFLLALMSIVFSILVASGAFSQAPQVH